MPPTTTLLIGTAVAAASGAGLFWQRRDRASDADADAVASESMADTPSPVPKLDGVAYYNPLEFGGSMFERVDVGVGEPLNVIISGLSDPIILTTDGLQNYLRSLSFDRECLGLHAGGHMQAFLDNRGYRDQSWEYREIFTELGHVFGACFESLVGGNHLRANQQNGSGAWFLAVSKEQDVTKHHDIVPNGYDLGRDELVTKATVAGGTEYDGQKYVTTVEWVDGLLPSGSAGVNHGISIDGRVALLTVKLA